MAPGCEVTSTTLTSCQTHSLAFHCGDGKALCRAARQPQPDQQWRAPWGHRCYTAIECMIYELGGGGGSAGDVSSLRDLPKFRMPCNPAGTPQPHHPR